MAYIYHNILIKQLYVCQLFVGTPSFCKIIKLLIYTFSLPQKNKKTILNKDELRILKDSREVNCLNDL